MTPNCPGCTVPRGSPLSAPHRTPESCLTKIPGSGPEPQESPIFYPRILLRTLTFSGVSIMCSGKFRLI